MTQNQSNRQFRRLMNEDSLEFNLDEQLCSIVVSLLITSDYPMVDMANIISISVKGWLPPPP